MAMKKHIYSQIKSSNYDFKMDFTKAFLSSFFGRTDFKSAIAEINKNSTGMGVCAKQMTS
jgi:hypothetical protein